MLNIPKLSTRQDIQSPLPGRCTSYCKENLEKDLPSVRSKQVVSGLVNLGSQAS